MFFAFPCMLGIRKLKVVVSVQRADVLSSAYTNSFLNIFRPSLILRQHALDGSFDHGFRATAEKFLGSFRFLATGIS